MLVAVQQAPATAAAGASRRTTADQHRQHLGVIRNARARRPNGDRRQRMMQHAFSQMHGGGRMVTGGRLT